MPKAGEGIGIIPIPIVFARNECNEADCYLKKDFSISKFRADEA